MSPPIVAAMSRARVTARDALLVGTDAVLALAVCVLAYRLRFEGVDVPGEFHRLYVVGTALVVPAWTAVAWRVGLHRRAALRPGVSNLEMSFKGALLVGVGLGVANLVFADGMLSRAWIALVTFGLVLAGEAGRGAIRKARRSIVPLGVGLERYAVVGSGRDAERLRSDLTRAAGAPFRVVAVLDPALPAQRLADEARRLDLDGLVVPDGELDRAAMAALAGSVSGSGIDVLIAPGLAGLELRVASIAMLHGVPLLRAAGQAPRRASQRQIATGTARTRGVAILGTRGVPANYGGFETFAENLALAFVDRGIPVTVYCRSHYASAGEEWRGVRLVTLPTVRSKYLDTVVHSVISALHLVLRTRVREVVLCNAANAPVVPLLRLLRRRVVINVDGLEWRRGKWGLAGRAWYRMGEWLAVRTASALVTDAAEVQTYYRVRHDTDSLMIPYGTHLLDRGEIPVPRELDARPDRYVLYVSRWERENNPVLVAAAHAASGIDVPLVMLGAATYDRSIEAAVDAVAAPHALRPGALFGDAYRGLQANALCYVHATEVGGTHPALIEALGAGNLCLVLDTPENREVAGEHARFFADEGELAEALRWAVGLGPRALGARRAAAKEYARGRYSWDAVTASYVALLAGDASAPLPDFSP